MTTAEKYYIAHTALVAGTAFLPSLTILIYSLKNVRSHKDPSRGAFRYFKAALVIFTLFCLLDGLTYGLTIAFSKILDVANVNLVYKTAKRFLLAQSYLNAVSQLFDMMTDILTMLMLLRVIKGILLIHKSKPSRMDRTLRRTSYATSFILGGFAVAVFSLRVRFAGLTRPSRQKAYSIQTLERVYTIFNRSRYIVLAFRIVVLVISVGILARAFLLRLQTRPQRKTSPPIMLIAASTAWFLRAAYNVSSMVATTDVFDFRDDPAFPEYYYVLDVVFSIWPQLTSLIFVFLIGVNKKDGLWLDQLTSKDPVDIKAWSGDQNSMSEGDESDLRAGQ